VLHAERPRALSAPASATRCHDGFLSFADLLDGRPGRGSRGAPRRPERL